MTKRIVKVFPDYCSSGLWENGVNMDESEVNLSAIDLIALRYWHEIWEFFIADGISSEKYIKRWNKDGQQMVDSWNTKQDEIQYVYLESN